MKKINARINQKDRVICVTGEGFHSFYYQPSGTKERIPLFPVYEFSGSVFAFFRDKGRNMDGRGFSLTIKELYEFKRYKNKKLTTVVSRIPLMIDDSLKEHQRATTENRITTHNEVPHSTGSGIELAA